MKLSVITTIYNGREYIDSMYESISNQTFKNFEWIIVDDGSDDKTWEKLISMEDSRLKLYKLENNKGVGYANSIALSLAKGEYIVKVDVDDISHTQRFERQIDFLVKNTDIDLVDSYIEYFPHDENVEKYDVRYLNLKKYEQEINQSFSVEELSEDLLWGCNIINGAMMARKKSIEMVGYDEKLIQGEDYQLFYKMRLLGMKFARLEQVLVKIRVSLNSTTAKNQNIIPKLVMNIKKNELESFLTAQSRPLVIWGTGSYGNKILSYLNDNYGITPDYFFDSNKDIAGKLINGIKVKKTKDFKNYRIIIASSYGKKQIIQILKNSGCQALEDYYII